jgi:flagellar hook-associated protein 2
MAGTINSLGLGSGVLTADLLDKLKAADTAALVTPIDAKITLNAQKTQALDLLNSLLSSFKSSVGSLDDDTLYQSRSVTGTNDDVGVTAASGSQIRDFSLNITNIAKKSVIESGAFTSSSALVGSGDGTLKLGIAGKEFSIAYTASTTLDGLKQAINDAAGTDVTASILQTGTSAFNLVLTSKTTGQNQAISLTDTSALGSLDDKLLTKNVQTGTFVAKDAFIASTGTTGNVAITVDGATAVDIAYTDTTTLQGLADSINANTTLNTKVTASIVQHGTNDFRMILTPKAGNAGVVSFADTGTGLSTALTPYDAGTNPNGFTATAGTSTVIQDGKDAKFTFDGISMTRSTNTISDIANGMTISLLKDGGSANVAIVQDRSKITTSMQSMVTSYNTLVKELGNMTAFDSAAGKVGVFNGDNTIKNISREISRMITSIDSKGNSLPQYGIELSKEGVMSLNTSTFTSKMDADPDGLEAFFSGKTTVTRVGTTKTSSFATASTLISSGASGNMTISIGGTPTSLAYTNTTTLQQMADTINANSTLNAKVSAGVVQNTTNDFRLVLTPKGSSVGETITLSDSVGGGLLSAMTSTTSTQDISSTTDGAFTLLNSLLDSYTSASNGTITNFTKATKGVTTALAADKTKAAAALTARYDTLTAKFAAYDSMISKLNNQFNALKQQIDAQALAASGG